MKVKVGDFVLVRWSYYRTGQTETWTGIVEFVNDRGGFGINWGDGGRHFPPARTVRRDYGAVQEVEIQPS